MENKVDIRQQRLERMGRLVSPESLERLRETHVMLFGLGGVGSYAAEALARLGFGKITLVDHDTVAVSNMNRQLPALISTVGQKKTDVVAERLRLAAPDACIETVDAFCLPQSPVELPADVGILLDAVDTVAAKLYLAETARQRGIPIVSCMGMGNRLDPTRIRIGDLFETSGCPLCRVMRRELRKRGMTSLRCVYSTEEALQPRCEEPRPSPGSLAVVPSVAGLYMAYEAFRLVAEKDQKTSVLS